MSELDKANALRRLILALHDGEPFDDVKARFDALMVGVSPEEIAAMEQQLIREGLPVAEVQRLCDLHVGVLRSALEQEAKPQVPPGHPIHTYMLENRLFEQLADEANAAASQLANAEDPAVAAQSLTRRIEAMASVGLHYTRKENQLFPYLERHGISGPTQVMWGIHDEIRHELKAIAKSISAGTLHGTAEHIAEISRAITEMIYKEEKILFPLALENLSLAEWVEMRQGDDAIGYATETPVPWSPDIGADEPGPPAQPAETLQLSTGALTRNELDRILTHLPVEISFVAPDDTVRYYSDHPDRIFPRSPAAIGRRVENCHPPKSLAKVMRILEEFKAGTRNTATFWIQLADRFILIRYIAVRDEQAGYLGCLEVTEDITEIRSLSGEQRLLDEL